MRKHLDRPVIGVTYSSKDLEDFGLWRHMFHAFVAAGATPLSIDCTAEHSGIRSLISRLDGLVIGGGGDVDPSLYGGDPDDPLVRGVNGARDSSERLALQAAMDRGLPILAICRGLQLVNVILGGTLHADLARDRGRASAHQQGVALLDRPAHVVEVRPGSLLATWMGCDGTVSVNSEHHQGVRDLAPSLARAAVAPDGLLEAFELAERRLVGVQWHPEVLWPYEKTSADLLRGFVDECATARAA